LGKKLRKKENTSMNLKIKNGRSANTRFAKSGNNCFDLKIYVNFVVYTSG